MATKRDRLRATLCHVEQLWVTERRCQDKNAVNEGAWSVQVIEPVLAALDWPRLRKDNERGTGAFFEWPGKHEVDVAVLRDGKPLAFLELKQSKPGCRKDLAFKLTKYSELHAVAFGVAAWFLGKPGFCIYQIGPESSLTPDPVITLADACTDPAPLAKLAAAVLFGDVPNTQAWLDSPVTDAGPIVPRCAPRDAQRRFFAMLSDKLKFNEPLKLRWRCLDSKPPTPTYAFTELPGVLPDRWGLVFDFDNTMNRINCFFYRDSNVKSEEVEEQSFDDDEGVSDRVIEAFLDERVLPHVAKWRQEAMTAGLLGNSNR